MMSLLRFLLTHQLKRSRQKPQTAGFTLIELLVGLVLAVLVITPLLGFMVNLLDTERREEAKVTTDQEIQTALDYIARDLEQAIYIYDATGLALLTGNYSNTTCGGGGGGGCSQLPAGADKLPVLAFWKRQFLPKVVPAGFVPCDPNVDPACTANTPPAPVNCNANPDDCDDAYVYSLVAYYLIKDNACNANSIWSCAARIGRFQISGGVVSGATVYVAPDAGFQRFNLRQAGSFTDKMNAWTKGTAAYTKDVEVLIDYADQSTGGGFTTASCAAPAQQVPDDTAASVANKFKTSSFYACVQTSQDDTSAEVFIRGNALARLRPNNPPSYSDAQSVYFPSQSVRAKGRAFLSE